MDELQISGKRFISSRRIARDNGYTADYIGQLIRGGKVIGQKVGRAWYVDATSFESYLGSEGTPAKLPEEKVLGSAPPQPDHFLQEVLPPQVSAPIVEPIKIKEIQEPPAPPKKIPEEKIIEPVIVAQQKEETYHIPLHVVSTEAPIGLRYYAEDRPSLPEIREIRTEKNEPWIAYPAEETKSIANDVFAPHTERRLRPARVVGLAALGITVFIFSAFVSSLISLNLSIESGSAASAWYSLHW